MKQYVLFENGDYQLITTPMQIEECNKRGLEILEENHPKIVVLLLEKTKTKKLQELGEYDCSAAVNSFTIDGIEIWLPKELRTALKNRAESILSLYNQRIIPSKVMEIEVIKGVFISLDADIVIFMLQKLEYYAGECYMVTSRHAAAINDLTNTSDITIEKILDYNFKVGYPEKLNF